MARHSYKYNISHLEKKVKRKDRKKKSFFLFVIIIIIFLSIAAGLFAYNHIVDSRLSNSNSNANSALSKTSSDNKYYLIKVNCGIDEDTAQTYNTPTNTIKYFLLRINDQKKEFSSLFIRSDIGISAGEDEESYPLYRAEEKGGDAQLLNDVKKVTGVDINHYLNVDIDSIAKMINTFQGLKINLEKTIDDNNAGNIVLKSGDVQLDSNSIKYVMRANDIAGGDETIAKLHSNIIFEFLKVLVSGEGFDQNKLIDDFSSSSYCDLSSSDIATLISKLKDLKDYSISSYYFAGSIMDSTSNKDRYYQIRTSESEVMLSSFKGDQQNDNGATSPINTGEIHVEVRNGAGISGAAAQMKSILEKAGYVVDKAGNASEGNVFNETLIVYLDKAQEGAANAIAKEFNCGRCIYGGDYYESDSQIITIVGADWAPAI